jgi:hypothetical protein
MVMMFVPLKDPLRKIKEQERGNKKERDADTISSKFLP